MTHCFLCGAPDPAHCEGSLCAPCDERRLSKWRSGEYPPSRSYYDNPPKGWRNWDDYVHEGELKRHTKNLMEASIIKQDNPGRAMSTPSGFGE